MSGAENHPHPGKAADAIVFAVKAGLLRVRRAVRDASDPAARRRPVMISMAGDVLAEVVTPLYTEHDPNERALQLGKVQNLRIGAKAIDGARLEAGQVFSFWAQVGRPTRARGFVEGRELRQGCIIPTVAGGLCQLSNSLFRAARHAGCEIVERHGHTAPIPNSPFPPGEDATVFWNYVDLRFRARRPVTVRVRLSESDLIVRLEAA
ncbi:VanW family protein [Asticcacaulis solisilvae]|uniref:VanW family protein n=1 Tax=Asticcacaulis solisilvae TaxID=1217274 RepID=UPI003FD78B77